MIKLSIKDRVVLPQIFAANKDSMTEAAVQRSIRQLFVIGEAEAQDINLVLANNRVVWDAQKGLDKEFELSPVQVAYLKDTIYTLSKAGGVSQDLLPICEKLNSM